MSKTNPHDIWPLTWTDLAEAGYEIEEMDTSSTCLRGVYGMIKIVKRVRYSRSNPAEKEYGYRIRFLHELYADGYWCCTSEEVIYTLDRLGAIKEINIKG